LSFCTTHHIIPPSKLPLFKLCTDDLHPWYLTTFQERLSSPTLIQHYKNVSKCSTNWRSHYRKLSSAWRRQQTDHDATITSTKAIGSFSNDMHIIKRPSHPRLITSSQEDSRVLTSSNITSAKLPTNLSSHHCLVFVMFSTFLYYNPTMAKHHAQRSTILKNKPLHLHHTHFPHSSQVLN